MYPDGCHWFLEIKIPGARSESGICYLRAVIKNETDMEDSITITIEVYKQDGEQYVWIATENSSGCKYKVEASFTPGAALDKFINEQI